MPSTMGRATGPPAGALVLPPREPSRLSAHARDRPTVALLASTASLLRDMLASPDVNTEAEAGVLFSSFRGSTPSSPADVLAAATYVETMGGAADPVDAASRGITAGTLGSACVNLLNDLEDCLLTGKLHEAFLAAVKISDYRSRLYVLRLLLDRVPADRLHAAKALVTALALSRRDADAAEKNDGTLVSRDETRRDPSSASRSRGAALDPVLRALAPCVLRAKGERGGARGDVASSEGEKENRPDGEKDGEKDGLTRPADERERALDVLRLLVRERRYLLFKGEKTLVRGEEEEASSQKGRAFFAETSNEGPSSHVVDETKNRNQRRTSTSTSRRVVESRVDRAYAALYSAEKKKKKLLRDEKSRETRPSREEEENGDVVTRGDAKDASDEDAFREDPFEKSEDPSEARRRMEAEMATSLEEAVRRARAARDRELRLTYVEPVPPPSRARVAEAYVREASNAHEPSDPRFPPMTPQRTYVRLHESREARARRLADRARRRARGEAVSEDDEDDLEHRPAGFREGSDEESGERSRRRTSELRSVVRPDEPAATRLRSEKGGGAKTKMSLPTA